MRGAGRVREGTTVFDGVELLDESDGSDGSDGAELLDGCGCCPLP